jgi:AraC-like DNA-binding protein
MSSSTRRADLSVRVAKAAPRSVAMAIRFMKCNLDRPLTTREIAAAAGTPQRSLRRKFQCFTEQSPIAFHRDLRLEAARHAICDKDIKADITTAAGLYGFDHLSHFTGQYRRRYGELPSATLHAARESFLPLPSHATFNPTRLIVLPFNCAEAEAGDVASAKMMTDLVIAALTRTRWLNVLSPYDELPTANNLRILPSRARYAVCGRVQRIGERVQAVLRLVDVATGRQIWGNAFEGRAECAIELQQRVTEGVAGAMLACLRDTEATRGELKPERDPVAVRCAAQAFQAVLAMSQFANGRALEHLDHAQSIDPGYPLARALAAWCHAQPPLAASATRPMSTVTRRDV